MSDYDWPHLLHQINDAVLASDALRASLPAQVVQSGWLGFPAASDAEIEAAEARLQTQLPRSYREFVACSNGWRVLNTAIDRVWSVNEIDWFRLNNQDWINAFLEGMRRSGAQGLTEEALPNTLQVSEVGDEAVLLLNPDIVGAEGEWQAWFFSNWTPGADAYPSFWALMQAQHQNLLVSS